MDIQQRKSSVALLSVLSNSMLVMLKIVIGLGIGSVSVISEAIHSGVDLLAAIIALFAVKTAGKPADEDHPFGHGKIENISGTVEALLIFLAAVWIIYESVEKLLNPQQAMKQSLPGVAIMLISALVNLFISHRLFTVGKETDSVALQADAWHLRTDVWTSFGVMTGLLVVFIGEHFFPGKLSWVDPVTAICVALLIVRTAWKLTRQSTRDLLDASLPADEEAWIRDYLERLHPLVRGYHRLRTRKAGLTRFVEFHLIVEANMSVEESHNISDIMTAAIEKRFPHSYITIHIEPCDGRCKPICISGCLLTEEERETIRQADQDLP